MNNARDDELAEIDNESSDEDNRLAEARTAPYVATPETEERGVGQLFELLETLTKELQLQLGTDLWLLLLYGSHARGEAQPDSDVDLFIVLRRASDAAYEKVRHVAYKVMWEADFVYMFSLYLTDINHYQTLEQLGSSFLRNVQTEGKVLWKAA
jgi:predicted nucleotidyltransferase